MIVFVALNYSLRAASPEFDRAFLDAIDKLEAERGSHKPGSIVPGLVEGLLKKGSKHDVIEAIAKFLRDTSKKRQWTQALNLELTLDPLTDRTLIVKAMRDNLPEIFKIGSPRTLLTVTTSYLFDYGTPEDVERVKNYLPEVRANDPAAAQQIELTLQISEGSKKLREQDKKNDSQAPAESVQSSQSIPDLPPQAKHDNTEKHPTKQSESSQSDSKSWLVWLVLSIAAAVAGIGLFIRNTKS